MKLLEGAYRAVRGAIPAPLKNVGELHLWNRGYLKETGWIRSRRQGAAVDRNGDPLPWYTYPIIRFLDGRIPADTKVFEFGMGNSTSWWGQRAAHVTTVEHDRSWYERVLPSMPPNIDVILTAVDTDDYVEAASKSGAAFDILVIDGRRRVRCCESSLGSLSDRGIVIWDDFQRNYYERGGELLARAGFKQLPFWGLAPLEVRQSLTSIFYRSNNCLGI